MSKVISFQPLRSATSASRELAEDLSQAIASPFERDPRKELVDMQLGPKLVDELAPRMAPYELRLAAHSARDLYSPIERRYTRLEGEDVDLALLSIPDWIVGDALYLSALQEIRSAFKRREVRIISEKRDAGSFGLAPMLEEWQNQDAIAARLVPWSHLQEALQDLVPVPQIFGLDPAHLPEAAAEAEAAPGPADEAPLVFLSYSHEDTNWMTRLKTQLDPLLAKGEFRLWTDKGIEPGDLWEEEIEAALAEARAAVLLVSDSFLASKFIQRRELPTLLEAARGDSGLKILWVYLEHSHYEETEIRRYQATHRTEEGRLLPLEELPPNQVSKTLKRISRAIRDAVVQRED